MKARSNILLILGFAICIVSISYFHSDNGKEKVDSYLRAKKNIVAPGVTPLSREDKSVEEAKLHQAYSGDTLSKLFLNYTDTSSPHNREDVLEVLEVIKQLPKSESFESNQKLIAFIELNEELLSATVLSKLSKNFLRRDDYEFIIENTGMLESNYYSPEFFESLFNLFDSETDSLNYLLEKIDVWLENGSPVQKESIAQNFKYLKSSANPEKYEAIIDKWSPEGSTYLWQRMLRKNL